MEGIFRIQRELVSVEPTILGSFFNIPITDSFLLSVLITVLVIIFALFLVPKLKLSPSKWQSWVEVLYEQIVGLIDQVSGSRAVAVKSFPLVAALIVYIGAANFIGLVPGLGSITYAGESVFRTPTSDLNTTLGLALGLVVIIQITSIKEFGIIGHLGKYIKIKGIYQGFKKGIKDGMLALVDFFVGLLDVFSELAKVASLSFRLFGNMFAGELLAVLILGAFAFVIPSLWLGLNVLFALVQTVVFGALAAAYYKLALSPEEG